MRVLLALALVVPVCLVAVYVVRFLGRQEEAKVTPFIDLAKAVRLLDRASTCDDVMPYMSSEVREEVREFLSQYKGREIG